jgi:hypothetical protein
VSVFSLYSACNAMATALGNVTPPTGDLMRKAYGQWPNNTPVLPCAVVEPKSGELILAPGAYNGTHSVDVVLLIEKASADFARIETRRQKWLPVIYHAFDSAMALGLSGTVNKVYPTGYEFVEFPYAGVAYDAIVVHFAISTTEIVTLAA